MDRGLAIKLPDAGTSPFDGEAIQLSLNFNLLFQLFSRHG
jgi:hypothetical protein